MVEHNLAKVGVASSSLVFRSKQVSISWPAFFYRGLELATRSPRELPAGPAEGTTKEVAPRSPRELPAGPAEGTTKEVAPCPRTRARVSFSAPSRSAYSWPAFFIQGTRTRDLLPEGAAGQGRLRGLRKKSRHARVREFESRFPLHAGQR